MLAALNTLIVPIVETMLNHIRLAKMSRFAGILDIFSNTDHETIVFRAG